MLSEEKDRSMHMASMHTVSSKIRNPFLVLLSSKMMVSKAGVRKMLVRIANREDNDQTASSEAI